MYQRKEYKKSGWWQELQQKELSDHTSRAAKRFRLDLRVPYAFFLNLVELVRARDWFPTRSKDAVDRECIPVELKVRNLIQQGKVPSVCHLLLWYDT